jgi:hypothetical protein
MSFRTRIGLLDQGNAPGSLHVPMVYEQVPLEPVRWEYHVMVVDTREMELPDTAQLNELGTQGWLLVGILNQGVKGRNTWGDQGHMTQEYVSNLLEQEPSGRGSFVYYYFVRQRSE